MLKQRILIHDGDKIVVSIFGFRSDFPFDVGVQMPKRPCVDETPLVPLAELRLTAHNTPFRCGGKIGNNTVSDVPLDLRQGQCMA